MKVRTDNALAAKLEKTRAADAAHRDFMNFIARELGCDRDRLSAKMADASKVELDTIKAKYEARKEAA